MNRLSCREEQNLLFLQFAYLGATGRIEARFTFFRHHDKFFYGMIGENSHLEASAPGFCSTQPCCYITPLTILAHVPRKCQPRTQFAVGKRSDWGRSFASQARMLCAEQVSQLKEYTN